VWPRSRKRVTIRTWATAWGVQAPSYWGTKPSLIQRRTVAAETPARAATLPNVGSSGANSAGSLVGDAAIEGSLKSPGVNHSEPVQQAGSDPVATRTGEPPPRGDQPATPRGGAPIHLRPTAALAERVLLPGDPGRALMLAQFLLEQPLMFNHHRGLWGYTGMAAHGEPLTIQSTGMGGPSAAIVLHELIALGVMRAIRVGTCGALDPTLGLGELVVVREAIAADGTSAALGANGLTNADPALTDALADRLGLGADQLDVGGDQAEALAHTRGAHQGRVVSTDLFYERDSERNAGWSAEGAIAVEMEASALFAIGAATGIQVACLLAVTDTFDRPDTRTRIDDATLVDAAEAMGSAAIHALRA
jgi:uridine phosphorylase